MDEDEINVADNFEKIELPKPDRPVRKRKNLSGYTPAVEFNSITGQKEFIPRVGDVIFIEFRGSPWRDDTYYQVDSIDGVTGDLLLFNLDKKNCAGSNFRDVEKFDYHIWIPPAKQAAKKKLSRNYTK